MIEQTPANPPPRLRQALRIEPKPLTARNQRGVSTVCLIVSLPGLFLLAGVPETRADLGPPVKIVVVPPANPAASGKIYTGTIEVHVGGAGLIEAMSLTGDGWRVVSWNPPLNQPLNAGDVLDIPFRALPTDASKPLRVRLTFNGWTIGKTLDFSPQYFARAGKPRSTMSVEGTRTFSPLGPIPAADWPHAIHFHGRIAYTRAGRDLDGDGTDDIPAQTVGVDGIPFEIKDLDDDFYDEVMYSGHTDQDGYFDVTISWEDCDIITGCDDPDIYIRYECDTGTVNVQSAGIIEEDYSWSSKDTDLISNFTGNEVDFGTRMPADAGDHPALHIFNSIVRAHRFIETRAGLDVPEVDVQWPEDSAGGGDNAHYYDDEIFISSAKQWKEDTASHEYGHHFMAHFSRTADPDYCNGFCDASPDNCGHCNWCPETDHDALGEGWPDWLADVVTRSYPADYGYAALFTRSQERLGICDEDNDGNPDPNSYDPFATEGYIGALLRDIDDDMEDQDKDGVPDVQPTCARDALNLGFDEIFTVMTVDQPLRPSEFINAFRARYPQYDNLLWQTANAVAPEYTWADAAQPEAVSDVTSPSHPLGTGGTSPFILVQWTTPGDDASGIGAYSIAWSQSPEGPPDLLADVEGAETVATSPPLGLGQWYFSIRTRDCVGQWDDDFAWFGPFEVTECDGNGIVDLCDTGCHFADDWCNVPGCGGEPDCNINGVPDACDVADGTSSDCDMNGSPDECDAGSFVSWIGSDGFWHQPFNWDNSGLPGPNDHVCIDVPTVAVVTHSEGNTEVLSIRSAERFVLSGGTLSIASQARMESNLTVGFATLSGAGDIDVDGLLTFESLNYQTGTLTGSGRIDANGGILIDGHSVWLYDTRRIRNWGPASFRGEPKELWLNGSSVFENSGTFQASDAGSIRASSGSTPRFVNLGTFEKSGPGTLDVSVPFDNWGEVFVLGGILVLNGGSDIVSDGLYSGSLGAVLEFGKGTLNLGPQSRVEAHNVVFRGQYTGNVTVDGTYDVTGASTFNNYGGVVTFTPTASVVSYGDSVVVGDGAATVHFNADEPVQINHYVQSNGWANFNTGLPVTFGTLEQSAGYIKGGDAIEITGHASCSGYLAEAVRVNAVGGLTINRLLWIGDTAVLTNRATATYTGVNGVIHLTGTAVLSNMGTLNAETDGLIGASLDTGRFTNSGIFNKLGAGNMTINVPFDNSGAVSILSGTLLLRGPGTQAMTGSFNGAAGAILDLGLIGAGRTATYNFSNTSSIAVEQMRFSPGGVTANIDGVYNVSGSTTASGMTANFSPAATILSLGASLVVSGGTVNFNNDEPISVTNFTLSSGTANFNTGRPVSAGGLDQTGGYLAGGDTLAVNGLATWSGGYMQGNGRTHTDGGLNITGFVTLRDARALQTAQTTTFSGASRVTMLGTATLVNQGTFDALSDGQIQHFSGTPRYTNNGTFNKLGPGTLPFSVACTNAGRFDVQAGLLQFSRAYTQTAGATVLNGGNIQSAQTLDIQGGQLAGAGTITGNVTSNGTVSPGTSTSILNISGNYTQTAAGELDIEIGRPDPAGQFDQLKITGSATLTGKLRLTLTNDYSPAPGTTFVIMTFGSRLGELAEIIGPAANRFTVIHNANDVTLTALPPAPADFDGDGDVDGEDLIVFEACASGPGVSFGVDCAASDLDADGDTDQSDFAAFQRCYSGEDVPADPNCAE